MQWWCCGVLFALLTGCAAESTPAVVVLPAPPSGVEAVGGEEVSPRLLRRFVPLERTLAGAEAPASAEVELGRALYFDARLSSSRMVSCNSCHPLATYGATADSLSKGVNGRLGTRNAPTTLNAAGHSRQFWDGRAATVEEQASGPLTNPAEMGMAAPELVSRLQSIFGYRAAFEHAFPSEPRPITLENVGRALGAFERGLITPSRWDRYLRGDHSALTSREKAGARLFANVGCMVCHTGAFVGGTMFEKVGIHSPWPNQKDRGRKELTGDDADDMVFKVPSLRNVAQTAPYFHDGSVSSLNEAVRLMARHQLGEELTDTEAADIAAWLGSLTGDLPAAYIRPPVPFE
jgi:cytochrome c peroxidase